MWYLRVSPPTERRRLHPGNYCLKRFPRGECLAAGECRRPWRLCGSDSPDHCLGHQSLAIERCRKSRGEERSNDNSEVPLRHMAFCQACSPRPI